MNKWQKMAAEGADKRIGLTAALLARLRGVEPRGLAALYSGCDLETLAILGRVNLGMTTADWPQICTDAFSKRLVDFYGAARPAWSLVTRTVPLRNFQPSRLLRPGELTLQRKGEGGEIVEGTIPDGGEIVRLLTFAANYSVSATVFANDDVGVLNERVRIGAEAAVFAEERHFFEVLASNPVLTDGVAYFHAATRGNLLSGAAISETSLGAALAALRKQAAPGGAKLDLAGRYVVCGADAEPAALAAVKALTPGATPTLEVIASAHITGNEWYLFTSPSTRPAFVAGRLRAETGPELDVLRRFELDGVAWRVVTRIGVAGFDPRACVKNPGA